MSLLQTQMQNVRARSPRLSDWTLLRGRNGALACLLDFNRDPMSIISSELRDKAAAAVGSTVEVPVFDSETVTIGNTRSVTIADSENTSQLYQLSFTTYSFGFTMVPAVHMNNEVQYQEDFARKFNKYIYKLLEVMDSAALSALDSAKNQVYADLLQYSLTGNVVDVPLANHKEIFGDINPIMKANDMNGPYSVIGNAGIESLLMKLAELGIYNQENKTIQYADKQLYFTNNLSNATGYRGTGYALDAGCAGVLFRHEREALLGTKLPDGTEWSMTNIPGTDIPLDMYFYYSRGDWNAIAGAATADLTRGAKEHWGFAIEMAVVTAYNTDPTTYISPIMKFALNNV